MATVTHLTNPSLTVDSNDFSDQCTSAEIKTQAESKDVTAFGAGARAYSAGLTRNEISATLFLSYGVGEVETIFEALVGTTFDVVVAKASGAASADNPTYTLTGCYLESFTPIAGSVGEMSTCDVVFIGGVLTRAIA